MRTIADEMMEIPFFADMEPGYVELLAGCGGHTVIPRGTRLIREGEQADNFWVIREGRVAVGVLTPGRMITLETLHRGDILGWSWLLPPYRWRFDAEALDEVHAIVYEADCLREKCLSDPALGFHLTQRFASVLDERLQSARMQVLDLYGDAAPR